MQAIHISLNKMTKWWQLVILSVAVTKVNNYPADMYACMQLVFIIIMIY